MASKRKQVYLAVAGSVGIHLVVLFAWAFTVQWFPAAQAASQTPEQLTLEMVEQTPAATPTPEPMSAPVPTPPPKLTFHDTADLPDASRPPKDAVIESDRNTGAASELPPTGDKPLPSQKGNAVPRFAFDTHPFTPGDDSSAPGQNVAENMPPPVPATAPPPPRPAPPSQATPVPTPAPTAASDPRDMALLTPRSIPSTPAEAEPNPYDPSFRPPTGMTEPPRPTPVPRRGGYRTMQERTQSVGSVSTAGSASIASVATPMGRYKAAVVAAIDRRWRQYFVVQESRVSIGSVVVVVVVDRTGALGSSHVISNTGNQALASMTLRAVLETTAPPMPEDVVAGANGERLSMPISFSTLPPPQ